MKVKHIFIFSCYALYFLALFLNNHFEICNSIDAGIIFGCFGFLGALYAIIRVGEWLIENWDRNIKF